MSVEVRPYGVRCNLRCAYCYQDAHRRAGAAADECRVGDIIATVEKAGTPFHLFGGEPLLLGLPDLERLLRWGFERFGVNELQTNGVLFDERHRALFRKYNVRTGVSIDGPGELNDLRRAGTAELTRLNTAKTEGTIAVLAEDGLLSGVQVQLSRCNCAAGRIGRLHDWFRGLDRPGVTFVRLHVLEIGSEEVRREHALTMEENLEIMRGFRALQKELRHIVFDVFSDARKILSGAESGVPCVWRACDPYYTQSVTGIGGDGTLHNCGLTDREGVNFQKPPKPGYERYIALYHTPREEGGCGGCRFFIVCKGHCPGAGIDGDWRNRSEYCPVWEAVLELTEQELLAEGLTPLSLRPDRKDIEARMVAGWLRGFSLDLETDLRPFEPGGAAP